MMLRPKTAELEPVEREVLQRLWAYFKEHRAWPQLEERLRIEFAKKGQDFDAVSEQWKHIHISRDLGQDSEGRMSAGLDDLLYLPEVRELFAPLPRLLKLAAERLKEKPTYERNLDEPRITLRDMESLWGNAEQAGVVAALLENAHLDILSHSGSEQTTGPYFLPRVEVLRFEDVTTLKEVEQLSEREPLPELTTPPRGIYRLVLRALHGYCKREFRWPAPVRFVVEQLEELGYTAAVLRKLHPDFLTKEPYFFGRTELELTVSCLEWVTTKEEQHLLIDLIQEMVRQYENDPGKRHRASLADMAGRVSSSVERLAPLLKYLHNEPWGDVEMRGASPGEWKLFWDKKIYPFREVKDWVGYLKKRDELKPGRLRQQFPSYPLPTSPGGAVVGKGVGVLVGPMPWDVVTAERPRRLFISFAGEDEALADALTHLLLRGCRIPEELITCTAWKDIKGGRDIQEELRDAVSESALVLCLVSENYLQSFYAVLELGAVWGQRKTFIPVFVPPTKEDEVPAVLSSRKAYFLEERTSLDNLGAELQEQLGTEPRIGDWGKHRERFLKELKGVLVQRQMAKKVAARSHAAPARKRVRSQGGTLSPQGVGSLSSEVPDEWRRFEKLVASIKSATEKLSPLLRVAVYARVIDKPLRLTSSNRAEAEEAKARGFVRIEKREDKQVIIPTRKSANVSPAHKGLSDLGKFLKGVSREFQREFEERYGVLPNLELKPFARQFFGFTREYKG